MLCCVLTARICAISLFTRQIIFFQYQAKWTGTSIGEDTRTSFPSRTVLFSYFFLISNAKCSCKNYGSICWWMGEKVLASLSSSSNLREDYSSKYQKVTITCNQLCNDEWKEFSSWLQDKKPEERVLTVPILAYMLSTICKKAPQPFQKSVCGSNRKLELEYAFAFPRNYSCSLWIGASHWQKVISSIFRLMSFLVL